MYGLPYFERGNQAMHGEVVPYNMKCIHMEPVTKQPSKTPIFIPLTIVPKFETKQLIKQLNNNLKILEKFQTSD